MTAALLLILAFASGRVEPPAVGDRDAPQRIVTLAPSVTELAFELGLGERVVGVTDWCRRPPEAATRVHVGGIVDPNLEAVAALRPDLVVLEEANAEVARALQRFGLEVLALDHRDVAGILESITLLGEATGRSDAAVGLRDDLTSELDALLAAAPPPEARPRVLLVVGRDASGGELRDVYAAARGTFLGELLEAAGGRNVLEDEAVRYPTVGREALLRLRPDHVLELVPELAGDPEGHERLAAAWADVGVPARKLHVLTDEGLPLPGPGFVASIASFARAIHDGE